ncbi:MAG: ATP-dependent DNA helicase RecQ [Leeuwenhoekiella sp.]
MIKTPTEILSKYWGFNNFRPNQAEIIDSLIKGNDTLALLPTGGGKSLCYQLPAVLKPGIAIVVSPLLSLMKDQVMQLNHKGIKALYLPGGLPYKELDTLLDNCIYGNYKLLYLSPERLQQELVLERVKQMPISLLAIDEAHCISQWGHDFRPAYRNIISFRESIPEIPCIALTATATKKVQLDIIEQLHLKEVALFQTSFNRKNLAYRVLKTEDKYYRLEEILKKNKGPAIVYVRSRKTAHLYTDFLRSKAISAHFYHGGLSSDERHTHFMEWTANKTQVMVATNAFGMGIDKPDVQTVIHVELPESIESYFQEAGRAGRDGKAAYSYILYSESDKDRLHNQFIKVLPSVDFVRLVYKKLNSYFQISYGEGEQEIFRFNFMDFCKTYQLNTITTYNALQILDRNSVITLSQEFYRKATLQIKVSAVSLSYYLIKNPGMDEIVKNILRTYGGIFDQKLTIDHTVIAQKSNKKVSKVHAVLIQLAQDDMAVYDHINYDTSITFLVTREDERTINPIVPDIKAQNSRKIEQAEAFLNYINNKNLCRNVQLLSYFDETNAEPCGICDVCLRQKQSANILADKNKTQSEILNLLSEKNYSSRAMLKLLPDINERQILSILNEMLEKRLIKITEANTYKIL